jgi:hypothetical protein
LSGCVNPLVLANGFGPVAALIGMFFRVKFQLSQAVVAEGGELAPNGTKPPDWLSLNLMPTY